MKVLILCGSSRVQGTTAFLADEFCQGAKDAGHEVIRFETAQMNIHPCIGCAHCRKNDGNCVYNDDMRQIYPHLLTSDVIAFVTPLYYFGMTAQLKIAIDRFYAISPALRELPKMVLLIAAGADKKAEVMDALKAHVQAICRYLHWQQSGMVLALGANSRKDVENSEYQIAARNLGRELSSN